MDIAYDWLTVSPYLLVIHYENILEAPYREVKKILDFLKFPIDKKRFKCMEKRPQEYFKRRFRPEVPSNVFSDSLRKVVDEGIEQVQSLLARR